jgi:hypothetical protein
LRYTPAVQIVLENNDIDVNIFSNPGELPHHLGLTFTEGPIKVPIVLDRMTAIALATKMLQALQATIAAEPPPPAEPVYGPSTEVPIEEPEPEPAAEPPVVELEQPVE